MKLKIGLLKDKNWSVWGKKAYRVCQLGIIAIRIIDSTDHEYAEVYITKVC